MKMFVIQIDDVFMAKIIKIRATHRAKTVNKLANECRLTKIEKIVLFPNVSDRLRSTPDSQVGRGGGAQRTEYCKGS